MKNKRNNFCPLCKHKKYILNKKIKKTDIIMKYKKELNMNVEYLFDMENDYIEKRHCSNCNIFYYNECIEGDSNFYEIMSQKNSYYSIDKREFSYAIKEILRQKNINSLLEIGCGGGYFLEKIRNYVEKIYGTEFNKNAINICHAKGIKIFEGNLNEINRTFDMIVSFQVFEHINDISTIIKECHSLLNKDGILLISVPNAEGYLGKINDMLDMPPHHLLGHTQNSFKYIENFGFELKTYKEEEMNISYYYSYLAYMYNDRNSYIIKMLLKCIALLKYTLFEGNSNISGHTHMAIFTKV